MNIAGRLLGISKSARYAVVGLVYLASLPSDRLVMVEDVAAHLELPPSFLAKLFQRLAHKGLLVSQRGPRGGYGLARPAQSISLADVLEAAQERVSGERDCLLEAGRCSSDGPCAIHSKVMAAEEALVAAFKGMSLAQAAKPVDGRSVARDLEKRHQTP